MKSDNMKKLGARIKDGCVRLLVVDDDYAKFSQTSDLVDDLSAEEATVTLVVNDFYQDGVAYRVSGLVLAEDGSTIARYWQRTESGAGIQCELTVSVAQMPEAFVISAQPDDSAVARPKPFDSREPARIGELPDTGSGGGGGAGSDTGSGSGGGTSGN